jgi:hypothetical protein
MVSIERTLTSATILLLCSLLLALNACGSSSDGDDDDDTAAGGSSGSGSNAGGSTSTPATGDLKIVFSPMYSGFDGQNTYRIPAIVSGVGNVEWSASDPSMVDLEPDADSGGVMITTRAAGKVTIMAKAGALSGSSELTITQFTPEQRALGEMRYNNNIPFPTFMFDPDAGMPRPQDIMIPDNLSCKNCHGSGATALDVEHTPQQTGGYSDDQLIAIITMGMKPMGAQFHTPIPPFLYTMFHTWDATAEEKTGLIAYLRSLAPATQGALDFGGLINMGRMGMQGTGTAGAASGAAGSAGAAADSAGSAGSP